MLPTFQDLQNKYQQLGIPTDRPGFYDHPKFVEEEKRNQAFLQTYYQFVLLRPYTDEEIEHARLVVPKIAKFLSHHLSQLPRNERMGRCIDMSMVVSRFLEQEGVWNAMVTGVVRIDFDKSGNHINFGPIGKQSTGHAWVFAPPFKVVDITLAQQPYAASYAQKAKKIPREIIAEDTRPGHVLPTDFYDGPTEAATLKKLNRPITMNDVYSTNYNYKNSLLDYPVVEIEAGDLTLTFAPLDSSAPDAPFDQITNIRLNNKFVHELYKDYKAEL